MRYFQFSENNSGGSWRLTAADYAALVQSCDWGLESSTLERLYQPLFGDPQEFALRHNLVGRFESYDAARASFESFTGQDLYAKGCECCGSPFRLYETALEGEFVTARDLTRALAAPRS